MINNLEAFLYKLQENLSILRERKAKYADNAPLDLLNEIKDFEQIISSVIQVIEIYQELLQKLETSLLPLRLREALKSYLISTSNEFPLLPSPSRFLEHQTKVQVLVELIEELENTEKSKRLIDNYNSEMKAVAILLVEKKLGVLLNIGKSENLETGTRFLLRRKDYWIDGNCIELPLGLIEVTYVQQGDNLSQAVILDPVDQDFWQDMMLQLKRKRTVVPPSNFVEPFISEGFYNSDLDSLVAHRQNLQVICNSLTRNKLYQVDSREE